MKVRGACVLHGEVILSRRLLGFIDFLAESLLADCLPELGNLCLVILLFLAESGEFTVLFLFYSKNLRPSCTVIYALLASFLDLDVLFTDQYLQLLVLGAELLQLRDITVDLCSESSKEEI